MPKFVKGLLWTAGVIAVIVLLLRLTVLKTWTVPSDPTLNASIGPSLRSGDFVVVLTRGDRDFGDLVRCADPENPKKWVIGRIAGLPGDRVKVERGAVVVNGRRYGTTEQCREDVFTTKDPTSGGEVTVSCVRIEIAGSWHYAGWGESSRADDGAEERTVGEGRFFLVSDNRELSRDSRDFGAVPAETCKEQIVFRLWDEDGFFSSKRRFESVR